MRTVLIEMLLASLACMFFAIVYNTPKKELVFCWLFGGIGYGIYYYLVKFCSMGTFANFFGAFAIAILARFTSKSKSFNNNVITPIMDKASKIKNEKIPQILADRKEKQDARKEKREETMKKIKRTKDNVVDKIMDTKDSTVGLAKKGIRAVVDFGREAKKATIRTIERAGEVKDNIKEGLRTAVENSTQTLEDLNGER